MSKHILSFFPISSESGKMESLEDYFFDSKQMICKLFGFHGLHVLEGQTTRSRLLPSTPFLNRFSVSPYEFATSENICEDAWIFEYERWWNQQEKKDGTFVLLIQVHRTSQQKTCLCDSLFVDLTLTKLERL